MMESQVLGFAVGFGCHVSKQPNPMKFILVWDGAGGDPPSSRQKGLRLTVQGGLLG